MFYIAAISSEGPTVGDSANPCLLWNSGPPLKEPSTHKVAVPAAILTFWDAWVCLAAHRISYFVL